MLIDTTKCNLLQECKSNECGPDVFMLPGYLEEDMAFDNLVKFGHWTYDKHDTYACFPPYDKCHHDASCIAEDVRGEIKRISGDKPVSIVGMCYGGNVAQAYATKWPEEVDKIALVMTSNSNRVPLPIAKVLGFPTDDLKVIAATDFEAMQKKITAPTFVYNCKMDELFGDPPIVPNSKNIDSWYCIHWMPPPYVFDHLQTFLDERSESV